MIFGLGYVTIEGAGNCYGWHIDCGISPTRALIPDFVVRAGWEYKKFQTAEAAMHRTARRLGIALGELK